MDFDYVNRTYFSNSMTIKAHNNGKEIEFYYVGGNCITNKYQITTMSYPDYNKAVSKTEKQSLKINI